MIPKRAREKAEEEDRSFITGVFLKYQRLMYSQIFQLVQDAWAAEDLLQDVLVKLMEKADDLRGKEESHLIQYVAAACRNQAKNYLRAQERKGKLTFQEVFGQLRQVRDRRDVEGRLIFEERMESLGRIWGRLDERSRFLLEHYYILEESTREIGRQLGIQAGSVRMALSRARKRAYALMEEEERTEEEQLK